MLKTLPDSTILSLKRQGQLIWRNYFSTEDKIKDAALSLVRERLGIEPLFYQVRFSMDISKCI